MPISATRPLSMTMTKSLLMIVFTRCAMVSTVQPVALACGVVVVVVGTLCERKSTGVEGVLVCKQIGVCECE